MANTVLSQYLQKCINLLGNMKHPSQDERPKSESKLKNVLGKVTGVCYVSSILNVIFKYGKSAEICIGENVDVRRSDKELDQEIAEFACQKGASEGRRVLVLPCDSNLHLAVAARIEEWYKSKGRLFNRDNPISGIADASCFSYDLCAKDIVDELTRHGYLRTDGTRVEYNLPSQNVRGELEQALQRFHDRIRSSLDTLSVRGYEIFSREITAANGHIQSQYSDALQLYCERQFSEKYSLYRQTGSTETAIGGVIRKLESASVGTSGGRGGDAHAHSDSMDADGEDAADLLRGKPKLIPVLLTCEAAHVLVKLIKRHVKPETISDFEQFVRTECGIFYVISPKYILSNIIKKGREIPPNFEFSVLLGKDMVRKQLKFGDLTDLANVLKFPGKNKAQERSLASKQVSTSSEDLDAMETGSHDPQVDIFDAFQKHVWDMAKVKAEKHRSTPVVMDHDAEQRCKERFLEWVKRTNSDKTKVLNKETFTKELVEICFEFSRMSSEKTQQMLIECGYLDIKGPDRSIVYKSCDRKPKIKMAEDDFTRFRGYWSRDYHPGDTGSSGVIYSCSLLRKRPRGMATFHPAKRRKVIDI